MVTRKDVAKLAGTSETIVSRVVNRNGYVSQEKREAVERAIAQLGYRQRPVAVAQRDKQTKLLFCSADYLIGSFYQELYSGVIATAEQYGYSVRIGNLPPYREIPHLPVDGIMLPNEMAATDYLEHIKSVLPYPAVCAAYGANVNCPKQIPSVVSDSQRAMTQLVEYLQGLGHKHIAFASPYYIDWGNPRGMAFRSHMARVYKKELDRYIFVSESEHMTLVGGNTDFMLVGSRLAAQICASPLPITAVVCFNDDLAIGLIYGLTALGKRVPQDLSVVGMDGTRHGRYSIPRLTTMSLSPMLQGELCAKVLIDTIQGKPVKNQTLIPLELIEGESVRKLT